MKFIYNKNLFEETEPIFGKQNRGFSLGDIISESIKVYEVNLVDGGTLFQPYGFYAYFAHEYPIDSPKNFRRSHSKGFEENQVNHAKLKFQYRNSDHSELITQSSVSFSGN